MKHETIKFVAKQYQHGWSLWIKADEKSMLLGSGIKNQKAVDTLMTTIQFESEPMLSRKEQQKLLKEVEELRAYKERYESLRSKVEELSSPHKYQYTLDPSAIF